MRGRRRLRGSVTWLAADAVKGGRAARRRGARIVRWGMAGGGGGDERARQNTGPGRRRRRRTRAPATTTPGHQPGRAGPAALVAGVSQYCGFSLRVKACFHSGVFLSLD